MFLPVAGELRTTPPPRVTGGLLSEEMGLGEWKGERREPSPRHPDAGERWGWISGRQGDGGRREEELQLETCGLHRREDARGGCTGAQRQGERFPGDSRGGMGGCQRRGRDAGGQRQHGREEAHDKEQCHHDRVPEHADRAVGGRNRQGDPASFSQRLLHSLPSSSPLSQTLPALLFPFAVDSPGCSQRCAISTARQPPCGPQQKPQGALGGDLGSRCGSGCRADNICAARGGGSGGQAQREALAASGEGRERARGGRRGPACFIRLSPCREEMLWSTRGEEGLVLASTAGGLATGGAGRVSGDPNVHDCHRPVVRHSAICPPLDG